MNINDSINTSFNLCNEHKCKLLYLVKGGSQLYGTFSKNSDTDILGLFLPPKEKLLVGDKINSLEYKTNTKNEKNNKNDFDIKLYSVQYFLKYLLAKSDTNAIDILYSKSNKSCILFQSTDPLTNLILYNENKLLEIQDIMKFSFVNFSISQAKRYGIKGTKLGITKQVYEYIKSLDQKEIENILLRDHVDNIINSIKTNKEVSTYISKTFVNGIDFLLLCGKFHMLSISMSEFLSRIESEYLRYGKRAEQAEKNEGIDWKSLSHALRGIYQMEELCKNGTIEFPLRKASILKNVKSGKYTWKETENLITNGFDELEKIKMEDVVFKGKYDTKFINRIILDSYNEEIN